MSETNSEQTSQEKVNLESLLKVPVNLSIEVGRKQMSLKDILDTREGTIVELERMLDEPLDIQQRPHPGLAPGSRLQIFHGLGLRRSTGMDADPTRPHSRYALPGRV